MATDDKRPAVVTLKPYAGKSSASSRSESAVYLFEYWLLLKAWWLPVLAATCLAVAAAWLYTEYVSVKTYRAHALLRPSQDRPDITGAIGALGGGGLSAMMGGLAGGIALKDKAEEYMSMLKSYQFSIKLIRAHNLASDLLAFGKPGQPVDPGRVSDWELYEALGARFDCDYNFQTGNIELSFVALNPRQAERVLGFFIDQLRDELRAREVAKAKAAIDSLEQPAKQTSDSVLQADLFELIAGHIEKETLAQAEAEFALKTIEAPVSPDRPYRPRVVLDCLIAGFATLFACSLLAAIGDWTAKRIREFRELEKIWLQVEAHDVAEEPEGGKPLPVGRDFTASVD